jgi:hypothetical protein
VIGEMNFGKPCSCRRAAGVWLLAAALAAAAAGMAFAEDNEASSARATEAAPAAAAPAASAGPAAPTANKPGFLHQLWEWWDYSISGLSAGMQGARSGVDSFNQKSTDAVKNAASATQDAMKSTAEATKGAASTLLRLPNTRMIEVRERCPLAPNGAPDCQTAAANACRGKGFSGGRPLDVVSAEKCPPAALLAPKPGETSCPVETVVSRVMCQ